MCAWEPNGQGSPAPTPPSSSITYRGRSRPPRLGCRSAQDEYFPLWGHMQAANCQVQYSCPEVGRNTFVICDSAHTMVRSSALIMIQVHSNKGCVPHMSASSSSSMASNSKTSQESRFGGDEQIVPTYQEVKDYQDEITQKRTPQTGSHLYQIAAGILQPDQTQLYILPFRSEYRPIPKAMFNEFRRSHYEA